MEGGQEMYNFCRICANMSGVIPIFGGEGREIRLEERIRKFLYISVSETDGLPKTVCTICTAKLQNIYEFAKLAARMQQKLVEMANADLFNVQNFPDNSMTDEEYSLESEKNDASSEDEEEEPSEDSTNQESVKGSLLHSILTKERRKEKSEPAVTELEVTVDPMLFLGDQDDEEVFQEKNASMKNVSKYLNNLMTTPSNQPISSCSQEDSISYASLPEGKPYQCSVCPRGFNSDISLKNHLWSHLSLRKVLATSDLNLNSVQSNSAGKADCTCSVCGRVYPTRSTLRAHQITHSDLRPHKCSLCEKTFKRNQDLKFHINQHTGERPYRCPYCPKAFASSGNCFSHRKRMHPKQQARDRKNAARSRQF